MDDRGVKERYPAVYRKVRSYMQENGEKSVSPSELVPALGFITREEVIRRVLDGADWAAEENGRYVLRDPAKDGQPARQAPASVRETRENGQEEDALVLRLRRVLEKETARSRIGVSAVYLKRLCGNPADGEIQRILSDAPWAVQQYGFYRYVPPSEVSTEAIRPANIIQREAVGAAAAETEKPAVTAHSLKTDSPAEIRTEEKSAPVCEQLRMDGGIDPEERPSIGGEDGADRAETKKAVPAPEPSASREKAKGEGNGWIQMTMAVPEDDREEMRVGTVLKVKKRARYWAVTVDFGSHYGRAAAKWSAGREAEGLLGQQVVCGIRMTASGREVRLMGIGQEGSMIPVEPAERVNNGERVE